MDDVALQTAVQRPEILVALSPTELPAAQSELARWCRMKTAALGVELREQRQNLQQAKAAKWKHTGWLSAVNKTKARMIYYAKIKAAVEAGYLIVPNFDIDVFAVRTTRACPPCRVGETTAQPDLSPHGRGVYVDDIVFSYDTTRMVKDYAGKDKEVTDANPSNYDYEPDLPLRGVKPIILEATARAMALKIFDQIGVVEARKQDPIIIGQIIDPSGNGRHWKKAISFFIAWWLDPATL